MSSNPTKYNFSGKVLLVTGSSSGIGAAIAIQFAQYGAKVTITGRNVANLQKVADEIEKVSGVKPLQIIGDLLKDDSLPKRLVDETIAKFGRLDFLVNNAGGATPSGRYSSPNLMQEYDSVFKVNLRVMIELTQRAVPHLEKTKGNVINISSGASMKPEPILVYSAAKAAVDMTTKCSALELGPKGIRVNSINPGPIESNFNASAGMDAATGNTFNRKLEQLMLMKRIGQPQDVANLASFLASDDAINITGSIMLTDSGYLLAPPKVVF